MPETIWGFPMPLDKAVDIADENDEADVALYEPDGRPFGPMLTVESEDTFESLKTEHGLSGSEYETADVTFDITPEEIRETPTAVDLLGL